MAGDEGSKLDKVFMQEVLRYHKCYVISLYVMRSDVGVHYMELNE